MKYIHRSIEGLVREGNQTFKCVLITGPRQAGKTNLIKRVFKNRQYVCFDDYFLEDYARDKPWAFMSLYKPPVIYDEIQRMGDLFAYIKMECDKQNKYGLFCLGSSISYQGLKNLYDSLCGRISIIELSGLSLREIMGDSFNEYFLPTSDYIKERAKSAKPISDIWGIIQRGSYPALQDPSVDWNEFYADYLRTYLERDVRYFSIVHNLDDFYKFMVAAATRTGQVLNYASIAAEIGKDPVTIKHWLSILEATQIIYLLQPYRSSFLKRAIKSPKIYFRDCGLAAYLTRWTTKVILTAGVSNEAFFETFVVSEILKSFANLGLDYRLSLSYFRNKEGKEIDLIIEENGTLYPIQINKTDNPILKMTSSFQLLEKTDKKLGSGAIICNCGQPTALVDNIFAIPVEYI